eukprot:scaffold121357_cov60-Attheya_sp.AAC.1
MEASRVSATSGSAACCAALRCDESTWHEIDSTSDESGRLARDFVSAGCVFVRSTQIGQHPIDVPQNRPENVASLFLSVQEWPGEGLVGRMLSPVQGGFSASGPGAT